MWILLLILSICGIAAGLWAARQGLSWGRPSVMGTGGLLVILLAWGVFSSGPDPVERLNRQDREYDRLATYELGRHLAEHHPGARVQVILPPGFHRSEERLAAQIQGLEEGFSGRLVLTDRHEPDLPEEYQVTEDPALGDPETQGLLPVDFMFQAVHLDALLEKTAESDLVILLGPLPADYEKLRFWDRRASAPLLALVLPGVEAADLARWSSGTRLAAAVLPADSPQKGSSGGLNFEDRYRLFSEKQTANR